MKFYSLLAVLLLGAIVVVVAAGGGDRSHVTGAEARGGEHLKEDVATSSNVARRLKTKAWDL